MNWNVLMHAELMRRAGRKPKEFNHPTETFSSDLDPRYFDTTCTSHALSAETGIYARTHYGSTT